MKRFLVVMLMFGLSIGYLSAQAKDFAKIGIVDMNRIMETLGNQSAGTKAFNEKQARFQAEINKRNTDIQDLNKMLIEAQSQGNESQAKTLENQLRTKLQEFQTYYARTNTELEREREQLMKTDTFFTQLNNAIRMAAEKDGITMVFNKDSQGLLWYSKQTDITSKVIAQFNAKR